MKAAKHGSCTMKPDVMYLKMARDRLNNITTVVSGLSTLSNYVTQDKFLNMIIAGKWK